MYNSIYYWCVRKTYNIYTIIRDMVFKVIVTHKSEDDDEHTYYGTVFPNRDIGQIKRLGYDEPHDRLEIK